MYDRLKAEISKQISGIENDQFAYLGPVLRTALFDTVDDKIDWEKVLCEWNRQNPENQITVQNWVGQKLTTKNRGDYVVLQVTHNGIWISRIEITGNCHVLGGKVKVEFVNNEHISHFMS